MAFAALGSGAAHLFAAQPNIVVIMSDDIGYNEFGFSTSLNGTTTQFETPNLDALAQQSVIARQGYVTHATCTPSRAGMLTGMYSHRFGIQDNANVTISPYGLPADVRLMPSYLKDLGYTTGLIGKWHLGYTDGVNLPQDKGFDEFYGFWGGSRDYFYNTGDAWVMRRGDQNIEEQYRMEGDPSKYDPVKGRYVTDAFGEESVDFINRHSNDGKPFFLFSAFNATHIQPDAKQVDLDRFAHIADPGVRMQAAMTYAYDRAVGEILDAIEDNGIAENTIVVLSNDNGGNSWNDNRPFAGYKGLQFEGGIRVPLLVRAPGVSPHVYDAPISLMDLLPTFIAAAGGDESQLSTDGVDLMPFLKGEVGGNPHETLFWRLVSLFAVRKGDWKLGNLDGWQFRLYNIAQDPSETNNLYSQRPDIVAELLRDFTAWEARMDKPMAGSSSAVNEFDHFVLYSDSASESWFAPGTWHQAGTSNVVTLQTADSYANLILEFPVKNGGSYVANNSKGRTTHLPLMLNQLRFTGNFTDATSQSGRSNGFQLLLVKSLDNQLPQLRLDATSSGTTARFGFHVDNELQLFDDLQITGDGTQNFFINGSIRDYYEPLQPTVTTPHNVVKTGTSQVTLTGNNTFGGMLTVLGGTVNVSGVNAAIDGAAGIVIGAGGTLRLQSGKIAVQSLDNSSGGAFHFSGGRLEVVDVVGDLANNGGTFAPGSSPALTTISGNFSNAAGILEIELGPTGYDRLQIGGAASLGGTLEVELLNGLTPSIGKAYQFLSAAGVNGTFANTALPTLTSGKTWNLLYGANEVILAVGPPGGVTTIPGDYNQDGTVDAADYVVWRRALTTGSLIADGNGNRAVEVGDFGIWRANFGLSLTQIAGHVASALAPEPTTVSLVAFGAMLAIRRRNSARWRRTSII
jgi:autotransporter-associated beta strand protein